MEFFLRKISFTIIVFSVISICLSPTAYAEFYKYVDENGVPHFVDNYGRIPEKYRDQQKTYMEKYDHLSEQQKQIMIEQERLEDERLMNEQRLLEDKFIQGMEAEDQLLDEQLAKDSEKKNRETAVTINGGQILVPVSIGYLGRQANIMMLLDTGASSTVIHRNIADQLHIGRSNSSLALVAGGQLINTTEAELNFIQVGPKKLEKLEVTIINHTGPAVQFDGLLGMDFLQSFDYTIDFENKVIYWEE